jgi:hypothetical protein
VLQGGKVIETIMSTTGTRQGCPYGGLVFAAGLQPSLKAAEAVATPDTRISAYLDDVKFSGKPQELLAPILALEKDAKSRGLILRFPKCKCFWMKDDPLPQEVVAFMIERNIPIITSAGIILGAPVGRDTARMQQLLLDIVKEHDRFFELLMHDKLSLQEAFLILGKSGVPRMSYISRCVRPEISKDPLQQFDDKVQSVAMRRLEISPDHPKAPVARKQLQLPVRLGGFGLRPSSFNRHFSWLGAVAAVAPALKSQLDNKPSAQLHEAIESSLAFTRSQLKADAEMLKLLPASAQSAIDFFANNRDVAVKFQKHVTAASEKIIFNSLLQDPSMTPADLARLNSLARAWAGWPAIIPISGALRLACELYKLVARMRLGYPVFDKQPLACKCGARFVDHPLHGLYCVRFHGQAVSPRHHAIVHILARWIRLVQGRASIEPARLAFNDNKQPDLETMMFEHEVVDVSIRHPTTPIPGAASDAAVAQKEKRYRELAEQIGARVTPFIIETFGAWDTAAREFAGRIRDFNDPAATAMSSHDVFYCVSTEVSIAVQRGNGRALLACYQAGIKCDEVQFRVTLNNIPRA